ncbi:MAG: hypothetical protein Q8K90_01320, partial [Brevundimonas sp.]|nr:hypothetical protein [Brevundimonas sp.]
GVLDITCGYSSPGQGAFSHLDPMDLMSQDCGEPKYVVSFSNGRRLTNLWVDAGRIVRIDDYPRHTIDP